jgi:hypothetical protein
LSQINDIGTYLAICKEDVSQQNATSPLRRIQYG